MCVVPFLCKEGIEWWGKLFTYIGKWFIFAWETSIILFNLKCRHEFSDKWAVWPRWILWITLRPRHSYLTCNDFQPSSILSLILLVWCNAPVTSFAAWHCICSSLFMSVSFRLALHSLLLIELKVYTKDQGWICLLIKYFLKRLAS